MILQLAAVAMNQLGARGEGLGWAQSWDERGDAMVLLCKIAPALQQALGAVALWTQYAGVWALGLLVLWDVEQGPHLVTGMVRVQQEKQIDGGCCAMLGENSWCDFAETAPGEFARQVAASAGAQVRPHYQETPAAQFGWAGHGGRENALLPEGDAPLTDAGTGVKTAAPYALGLQPVGLAQPLHTGAHMACRQPQGLRHRNHGSQWNGRWSARGQCIAVHRQQQRSGYEALRRDLAHGGSAACARAQGRLQAHVIHKIRWHGSHYGTTMQNLV